MTNLIAIQSKAAREKFTELVYKQARNAVRNALKRKKIRPREIMLRDITTKVAQKIPEDNEFLKELELKKLNPTALIETVAILDKKVNLEETQILFVVSEKEDLGFYFEENTSTGFENNSIVVINADNGKDEKNIPIKIVHKENLNKHALNKNALKIFSHCA